MGSLLESTRLTDIPREFQERLHKLILSATIQCGHFMEDPEILRWISCKLFNPESWNTETARAQWCLSGVVWVALGESCRVLSEDITGIGRWIWSTGDAYDREEEATSADLEWPKSQMSVQVTKPLFLMVSYSLPFHPFSVKSFEENVDRYTHVCTHPKIPMVQVVF